MLAPLPSAAGRLLLRSGVIAAARGLDRLEVALLSRFPAGRCPLVEALATGASLDRAWVLRASAAAEAADRAAEARRWRALGAAALVLAGLAGAPAGPALAGPLARPPAGALDEAPRPARPLGAADPFLGGARAAGWA